MPILNRTTLKGFYETGDKPTQAQFSALIDSNLNLDEDQELLGLREYNAALTYLVGDSVIFNEAIYVCINSTTGTFNPADWDEVSGTVPGGLVFKGTWNANTNVPDLLTASVANGDYYVVGVAGSTDLDGITDWQVGDWAIYNGTAWQKIDNTDMVSDGENVAGDGAGVFKTKSGTLLQFKKILGPDGSVSVIEDATNSFIELSVAFDDAGTLVNRAWSADKISTELNTKTDKVSGAVVNNFSSLDGSGNLLDSGFSGASFLPASAVASDIPVTPVGDITTNVQAALQELDTIKEPANPNIQAHIADMSNPHNTTKAQVGLSNVTNDQQLSLKDYQEAEALQVTASVFPTVTNALTFNFTPAVAGDYLVEWYMELSKVAGATATVYAGVSVDGNLIGEGEPRFTVDNQWVSFSGFKQENLTVAAHTIDVDFSKITAGASRTQIRRIRMKIVKV